MKSIKLSILFLLLALALVGCSSLGGRAAAQDEPVPVVTASPYTLAEGKIVPERSSWLVFSRPGKVAEVLVAEGQEVERGQVLARLGDREPLEASLAQAELERLSARQDLDSLLEKVALAGRQADASLAQAELDLLAAQEALEEIDTRRTEDRLSDEWEKVLDARDRLRDAEEEAEKYASLASDNANRKRADDALEAAQDRYTAALRAYDRLRNELDSARSAAALAEEQFAEAQRQAEARQNGPHPDDLALAQARLRNAEAQVASVQAALADLEMTAPYDGVVVELNLNEGEWVPAGQPFILVADFSAWYVETSDLTEMEVVAVEPGMRASLTPDALPGLSLPGEVERIAGVFTTLRGDTTYTVRIRLLESDPRLRWGMTVEAEFR